MRGEGVVLCEGEGGFRDKKKQEHRGRSFSYASPSGHSERRRSTRARSSSPFVSHTILQTKKRRENFLQTYKKLRSLPTPHSHHAPHTHTKGNWVVFLDDRLFPFFSFSFPFSFPFFFGWHTWWSVYATLQHLETVFRCSTGMQHKAPPTPLPHRPPTHSSLNNELPLSLPSSPKQPTNKQTNKQTNTKATFKLKSPEYF